jgi:serine/threonine protein kinase
MGRVFLGRYETIRLLGEGGMGRVYLAQQLDLGRQVVVKVMHDHIAQDPTFRERFSRETLLMARFQHPYAVTLYDASLNDPEGSCIVMEFIRGVTLDTILQRHGRLPPARVGRLLHQMCEVLQAAHAEGIVHRDLKPANLMVVDADSPYELLKVMDFGLAKLVAPGPLRHATVTNMDFAVGTPGYMCPEQAQGEEMDHRGDLYSVGILVYEMLTGKLPFSGASTMDVLLAQVTQPPPTFAAVGMRGLASPAIEQAVLRCLAKDPGQRPANARALAEMYDLALREEPAASPLDQGTERNSRSFVPVKGRGTPQATPAPPQAGPPPDSHRSPAHTAEMIAPKGAGLEATAVVPTPDALAVVHQLEAWMPERIAAYKLHGFVQDAGGEVAESCPGRIRVRLGGKESIYHIPVRGAFSWLGLGRKGHGIDMELHLQRSDPSRENHLLITVHFRPPNRTLGTDESWRDLCTRIFCDLRAYLMGQSHPISNGEIE